MMAAFEGASEKVEGQVSEWRGSWGFIDFVDGRRAYVHNTACGGNPLLEGQAVTADVVPDPQNLGKWQAANVERVASYDQNGRVAGVVSSWTGTFGFIQFSDGRRAYVHNSATGGSTLVEGETVVGLIVDDPKNPGKWQAQNVEKVTMAVEEEVADDQGLGADLAHALETSGKTAGRVTEWNTSWGFVEFTDGRRAYCHQTQCGGVPLAVGQSVIGLVDEDPRNPGKWQALEVERVAAVALDGRIEGTVTNWTGAFGFIQFSDGRRAYVHSSNVSNGDLAEGVSVVGLVVEDPKNPGKWQALNVQRTAVPQAGGGAAALGADRMEGMVTQWNEKGFGFVEFNDGRRAFVHYSACNGMPLHQGAIVTAVVQPDAQNPGKWQAMDVRLHGATAGVPPPSAGRAPPAAPRRAAVAPSVGVVHSSSPSAAAVPPMSGRRSGKVTEWNPRGFGFIMFEDGTRAYVHNSQCGGEHLVQGEVVSAELAPDQRTAGKWQATNIQRSTDAAAGASAGQASHFEYGTALDSIMQQTEPAAPAPVELIRAQGTVTEWNSRGFGFVMMGDGTRAYVHNSQCGGEHLMEGEIIIADVVPDPRTPGKWCAQNVERDVSGFENPSKRQRLV